MAGNLQLVPATAGKRLGAAVVDWLFPVAVLVVTFAIGFAGITRTRSGGFIIYDTASLVLFGSIGLGMTLVYQPCCRPRSPDGQNHRQPADGDPQHRQ